METKIVFVFDPKTSDPKVVELLTAFANLPDLPAPATSNGARPQVNGKPLGSGKSLRGVLLQLAEKGIVIYGVYKRHDGKIVFKAKSFTLVTMDLAATMLFAKLGENIGWNIVRYNNADGSTVFSANGPCFLSEQVKARDENGQKVLKSRIWANHTITI